MGGKVAKIDAFQSHKVPGTGKDGESAIYRSKLAADKLCTSVWDDCKTLWDTFSRGARLYPKNPCFGVREVKADGTRGHFKWETYEQIYNKTLHVGSALAELGFTKGNNVGIFAVNRPEWVMTSSGCYSQSLVPVPLYDTLGPEAVAYIINQAEIGLVACSSDKITKFTNVKDFPTLKYIVSMDETDVSKFDLAGIKVMTWGQLLKLGEEHKHDVVPPTADSLATICYTSGTTGNPKGVMLLHSTIYSEVSASHMMGLDLSHNDVYLSYLPLAHIYEKFLLESLLAVGAMIGFFSGQVLQLMDDIAQLKPTIFASVPRLFNRIYDRIRGTVKAEGGMKQTIFEKAYKSKLDALKKGHVPESLMWDSLVFKKVRARLGGRVRLITSGAAPLQSEVHDFLRVCFCVPVLQGYGLTETTGGSVAQSQNDLTSGNIGTPFPCVEYKLVDVTEMNYIAHPTDPEALPRGEICFRGPSVFVGYYKMDDKTKEVVDEDGWFHTGDIGQVNANGTLSIIDRKKNIFKLSQGEYVAAEYIEGVYLQSQFVQQIFVYGDSHKSVLVAIVVPKAENLVSWAQKHTEWAEVKDVDIKDTKSLPAVLEKICGKPEVKKLILDDMNKEGKAKAMKGFEFVKNIYVEWQEFTVESDLLTPTFKLKRPQAKEKYQKHIDDLYTEFEANAPKEQ
jgi:long-chain acyl-CoA synthetase